MKTVTRNWIKAPEGTDLSVFTFKKTLVLTRDVSRVRRATLKASAIGVYAPHVNGKRVGKGVLAPGWTEYSQRVQYQTYDILPLLENTNDISIGVGPGWAVSFIGFERSHPYFTDHVSLFAQIDITYDDGSTERILSDESWEVFDNEVRYSEIYHGETVDKTVALKFLGCAVKDTGVTARLVAQIGEWITEQERLAPVEIIKTPKGELVIDFGQNMTGYVELHIRAPHGSRIVMHHAEVLDKDGNFYTGNYRAAKNENVYICSGGDDVFKPTFTFQGFRYIRLTEYPYDTPDADDFVAIAVNSELVRTGYYKCGNEKINQLYHNIIWGQKSNYLDIPTDCPQRDERLGWLGDTQVFCRAGAINYDVEKFFKKWLGDVALCQRKDGGVHDVIPPECYPQRTLISAAWGDAVCIVPWEIYMAYGNKALLRENFPVMKKWVDYIRTRGTHEYLWLCDRHHGDWLGMDAGPDTFMGATSHDLIASAFFAYSASLVVKAGEELGEDVSEYKALYSNIVKAFREYFMIDGMPKNGLPLTQNYYTPDAKITDNVRAGLTQTGIALILYLGLCTDDEKRPLATKLVELIHDNGDCMSTGFVGTPYILHALSSNGYTDVAYTLLFQEKNPSWLYSVCHGATTIWEHWNSIKEDGSFWSDDMNSFNHYAYGAVFDWIFGVSSGIVPTRPAYSEIALTPHPDRRLGFADAEIESRNGKIRSHWYYKGECVYYEFEIPSGVTAHLTLPSGRTETLTGGKFFFAE